jgi:hypothetical protein
VERWRDSGLTAKEFASETGVKASTLSFWGWKLRADGGRGAGGATKRRTHSTGAGRRAARRVAPSSRFVEFGPSAVVRAMPAAATPALAVSLEVVLSGGVVVRVPAGFDEATLGRVVRALGAPR